ncbi:minor capsid protein [Microbacterium sp. 3J1]|uniref:phage tail terminator protein n=1 Tax=Microbacterium sp. 3J1 TaxID=861269 RepID=UPI000A52AC27|nr:minor capsid protein [Microbacterium sp. 3J1]
MADAPANLTLDVELTTRLAEILGRVPTFEWRPHGPAYQSSEVAIFYGRVLDTPDRAIGVRVYSPADEPHLSRRRVQLHVRGRRDDIADADRLADVLFIVLDNRLRGDGIASIIRTSFSQLGADKTGREERTENYLITLDNLEASS